MLKRMLAILLMAASPFAGSKVQDTQAVQGDYCPAEYHGFTIVCEDDWPCSLIFAKLDEGECWWAYRQ